MSDTPIVRAEGLIKDFGDVRAVDDISFEIEEGTISRSRSRRGSSFRSSVRAAVGRRRPSG